MPKPIHRVTAVVRRIEELAEGVRAFELADPDDWELPPFTAGSHIDVHLPSGGVRQYSLYGDVRESRRYRIAVKREDEGRGGSLALHRDATVGTTLLVSLPRNHFPLLPAPHHVMIAGGIGVTPLLAMVGVLARAGRSFELHYCSRTPAATPFLEPLAALAADGRVRHYFSRTGGGRLDVASLLGEAPSGAHVYCCGPASLMNAVLSAGGPSFEGRLHFEWFGSGGPADEADFEVELARSARVIPVPRGQTMLEALRGAGVEVPSSCEAGVCLECKTRFVGGTPIHRDLAMTAADRREYLTPCVSGCASGRLALDL